MAHKRLIVFLSFFLLSVTGLAQTLCTTLGQNPETAFPVCGTDTFSIASVAICGDRMVPGGTCNNPNVTLTDKNPYWYKFTCFTPGTLGFTIKPNNITDDYDWQIFDVTNHAPADIYTDASLFVACNWSGETGITGASSAGTSLTRCDGLGVPLFSSMPDLKEQHQYLLLVSHFSDDSQSGYSLSFGGGTASITDTVSPAMLRAKATCDATGISVKLNKKMKCSSLASDGSDLSISSSVAAVTSVTGIGCSAGFDTDSIFIKLGSALPPGDYTVNIETGTDGNNLLDNCDRGIPNNQSLPVTVYPVIATPVDSLSPVGCSPDVLELVFRDGIACNSIAADGSDFKISGTSPVNILGASGICDANGFTSVVRLTLSNPILTAGTFQVSLQNGTDGNTIINECSVPSVAGSAKTFTTKDTVSAIFASVIHFGCVADTVNYVHDGRNGVNSWKWSFDNNMASTSSDTVIIWQSFGQKKATLIVSNGTCSDTATSTILLDNNVTAAFESTAVVCPGDPAVFKDGSSGPVFSWAWNFGNGNTSNQQLPASQFYSSANTIRDVPVQLIVKSLAGCADTAVKTIRVAGNCYIAIPKAFSPNNDGLNDFLYPTNAYKARDLLFRVYNRGGQLIFQTRDWTNKWDGTFKGNPQDPGTYVWMLNYTNIDTGKRIELKGSTVLIR